MGDAGTGCARDGRRSYARSGRTRRKATRTVCPRSGLAPNPLRSRPARPGSAAGPAVIPRRSCLDSAVRAQISEWIAPWLQRQRKRPVDPAAAAQKLEWPAPQVQSQRVCSHVSR
ncbi:hypothetical protein EUA03_00495 [Mycolicibacterium mucogenicum]|uniref:Uncharacterized protein n=1 Tax=Mycolicibacterium mucogenicum TaxID=56689 RepID=A0A4R5WQ36_MYCMU|nr:hypothetical protein EUA03_00495 [Mycolicibacterium mucogenicum]